MIFGDKTHLEEYIVELLDKGPASGPALLERLDRVHEPITKQAMYKALRKLLKAEVVSKQKSKYVLNRYWLQKIREFSERHTREATLVDANNILNFENGDSVTYVLKSPYLMDVTWSHLYDILYDASPKHHVMLNYHPHEWLYLSRPETERLWLNRFVQDQKIMCFTIGGTSFLDRKFQKEFSSDFVKINLGETYGLRHNQYLAVQGDYIFEITTDEEFERKVHKLFEQFDSESKVEQAKIHELSKLKYKSKLKLSKNKKKADAWRKKFKNDYYIPRPYYL